MPVLCTVEGDTIELLKQVDLIPFVYYIAIAILSIIITI